MSGSERHNDYSNVTPIRASEAESIFSGLRQLREAVINAWFERGVMLTPEEQDALRAEIAQTCELLTDLTASR